MREVRSVRWYMREVVLIHSLESRSSGNVVYDSKYLALTLETVNKWSSTAVCLIDTKSVRFIRTISIE